MPGVLVRDTTEDTGFCEEEKRPRNHRGRRWSSIAASQGTPRTSSRSWGERPGTDSCRASRRSQARPHPDFTLLASKTLKKGIPDVLRHQVCGHDSSPREELHSPQVERALVEKLQGQDGSAARVSRKPACALLKDTVRLDTWASGHGTDPPAPTEAKKAPSPGLFSEQAAGWAVFQPETCSLTLVRPLAAPGQGALEKTQGWMGDTRSPTRGACRRAGRPGHRGANVLSLLQLQG